MGVLFPVLRGRGLLAAYDNGCGSHGKESGNELLLAS